jgi:predicted aspartyl protease
VSTFFHPITILGPDGDRATVDALVETGATFATLPRDLLLWLGVTPRRQVPLRLADGSSHIHDLGYATVELDDLDGPAYVVFGTNSSPSTIGAVTLEHFLLSVDPAGKGLVAVEGRQAAAMAI